MHGIPRQTVKMYQWEEIVEELMCQILWPGFDYEYEPEFVDVDPQLCGPMKTERHICEDYYAAIAPDPSDVQLEQVRQSLEASLSSKCRWEWPTGQSPRQALTFDEPIET